jgi:ribonuclease HII
LAGPVAVGVFAVRKDQRAKLKVLKKAKDSKVLSHMQREHIFSEIKDTHTMWAVGLSSSAYIDRFGIVPAIKSAMKKALAKLKLDPKECEVMLDGSLCAPVEYKAQKTIIKGDAKIPVISAASICAKVLRDRYMTKVAKQHMRYEFHVHKGYGTKNHREAIISHGVCKEHRMSFLKNLLQ